MRILITGGAGFIGARLAAKLNADSHEVMVIDNLATGLVENVPPGIEFRRVGAETSEATKLLMDFRPEAVAHVGGQSSGEIGETRPIDDIQWNVVSTLNLLTAAHKAGVRRFVYASSMGVYGQAGNDRSLKEADGGSPISIYGAGKVASETYLALFGRRGLETVSLRMFNVYGPGQNMGNMRQGMVSIYLAQLLQGTRIVVRGSLDRVRDFIYIDDVVLAWQRALTSNSVELGHVAVNVATGIGSTVRQLLDCIRSAAGDFEVVHEPGTPADQTRTVADVSLARSYLGWQPKTDLKDGIASFWQWASENHQRQKT